THLAHARALGEHRYRELTTQPVPADKVDRIKDVVSQKASENAAEFVAEVRAYLLARRANPGLQPFPDDIMQLFKEYGGPLP
ncbi:MAG TPA: hypothetical protein VGM23_09705, partial [Armatimonadota bacterium]